MATHAVTLLAGAIQNHPCSARTMEPFWSSSAKRNGRSAGVRTRNEPSASTGAVPSPWRDREHP